MSHDFLRWKLSNNALQTGEALAVIVARQNLDCTSVFAYVEDVEVDFVILNEQ